MTQGFRANEWRKVITFGVKLTKIGPFRLKMRLPLMGGKRPISGEELLRRYYRHMKMGNTYRGRKKRWRPRL